VTIGEKIKEARFEAGMCQSELARALNVTQPTVGRLERDEYEITVTRLQEVAKATGKPVTWFFQDADDKCIELALYCKAQMDQAFDETLKTMLATPPKPHRRKKA
jgi:transcriptional regulator with XRE-family HTH domain